MPPNNNQIDGSIGKPFELRKKQLNHKSYEQEKVNQIRDLIRKEEKVVRENNRLFSFEWQDFMGALFFTASVLGVAGASYAWLQGYLPLWGLVVLNALSISILHELEHDLIHDLYFKGLPFVQDIMFLVIWLLKCNVSPWWRRKYHLIHHQVSGTGLDVEERMIGLGLPWGIQRLIVTIHPFFALTLVPTVNKDVPEITSLSLTAINGPVIIPSFLCTVIPLCYKCGLGAFFPAGFVSLIETLLPVMNIIHCVINLPNFLRQSSLVIVSTWCHYYGDIPEKDVYFQTQVLDHWVLYPLQLFCFNFGKTHAIHHFVTKQPFYLRQAIADRVLPLMVEHGVRYNDLDNNFRSNMYFGKKSKNQ